MTAKTVAELSKDFAIDIINLCNSLDNIKNYPLINQLLRSGTSIGANIHEANYAASKADFINKLQIALKECHETTYWLDIFSSTGIINQQTYSDFDKKCGKIKRMLISSINTSKG